MARTIKKLNYRHEGVLRWLVENPHRKLQDCAAELGYSPSWLSNIINSQAFKAEYMRVRLETHQASVDYSVERLTGKSRFVDDDSSEESLLERLGYGSNKT